MNRIHSIRHLEARALEELIWSSFFSLYGRIVKSGIVMTISLVSGHYYSFSLIFDWLSKTSYIYSNYILRLNLSWPWLKHDKIAREWQWRSWSGWQYFWGSEQLEVRCCARSPFSDIILWLWRMSSWSNSSALSSYHVRYMRFIINWIVHYFDQLEVYRGFPEY